MSILQASCILQSKSQVLNFRTKENRILTSKRISFICKYFEKLYLISSAHDITSQSKDKIFLNNSSLKLNNNKKVLVPEIDLVIYEINDLYESLDFIDLENNKYSIDDINENTNLFMLDKKFNVNDVHILFMEKSKYNNCCFPDMLKYFGQSSCKDLEGCSGTAIFDANNNIYGILSGYGNKYLNITPFFFVKRILDEILHYKSFSGLCNFWHDTSIEKRNLVIAKREDIDYNLYQKVMEKRIAKLMKDDIILRFDDKNVTNGMIFCDLLNISVDIDTYISITKTIHSINSLHIFRPRNLKYKFLNIAIGNRDIYSAYNIDIKDDNLLIREIDDKIFIKINPMLFKYISEFRPVHVDEKLMNIFKLKQSEIFENNYLLVEDKSVNKNIFQHIPNSYISVKI